MAPPLSAGGSPVGPLSWPGGNQARRRFARNSKVFLLQRVTLSCTYRVYREARLIATGSVHVRQDPKNHQRDDDDIEDVRCRYGPSRRAGRAARLTKLPTPCPIAQTRTRQAYALLMALLADIHNSSPPSHREGSTAFRQVDPGTLEDTEAFAEAENHKSSCSWEGGRAFP
jgi:hypothetical protein